jgi:hypothetical protein
MEKAGMLSNCISEAVAIGRDLASHDWEPAHAGLYGAGPVSL